MGPFTRLPSSTLLSLFISLFKPNFRKKGTLKKKGGTGGPSLQLSEDFGFEGRGASGL